MRSTCKRVLSTAVIIGCSMGAVLLSGCGAGGAATKANLATVNTPVTTPISGSNPTPSPTPTATPAPTLSGVPHSSHVVLVIEENHMFSEVYPLGMPWLVAQGNRYGYATNYHADEPGSALDYFWLSSGSGEQSFGCTGDGCTNPITSDNIFYELNKAGLTWKVYAQSLPSAGYMGGDSGAYVDRHNPAKWYDYVIKTSAAQQNIVPFTQFAVDLAANQLPNYSLIIPDVNNDAHDGTVGQADTFLANNVSPLLNSSAFQTGGDGLLFVTFDECDGAVGACPQQVYTAVIGPKVKHATVSPTLYRHENLLRTMLEALGIKTYPGASSTATDMSDFF